MQPKSRILVPVTVAVASLLLASCEDTPIEPVSPDGRDLQLNQQSNIIPDRYIESFPLGHGLHWFALKAGFFMFVYLWLRATFPRYRYDQIMRLGWKVFIPLTIIWIVVTGLAIMVELGPWFDQAGRGA